MNIYFNRILTAMCLFCAILMVWAKAYCICSLPCIAMQWPIFQHCMTIVYFMHWHGLFYLQHWKEYRHDRNGSIWSAATKWGHKRCCCFCVGRPTCSLPLLILNYNSQVSNGPNFFISICRSVDSLPNF